MTEEYLQDIEGFTIDRGIKLQEKIGVLIQGIQKGFVRQRLN